MTEKQAKAWAYIVMDEGEESVLHLETDKGPYPMIGMDKDTIAAAAEYAQAAANDLKETVTLIEFDARREVRQFTPQARPVFKSKAKAMKGMQ